MKRPIIIITAALFMSGCSYNGGNMNITETSASDLIISTSQTTILTSDTTSVSTTADTHISSEFSMNDGTVCYYENGIEKGQKGIDVSSFQGEINWDEAAADGVDFAIIRIGFRGYGESGSLNIDKRFEYNIASARKAGIDVGVYFYSQAVSIDEAAEEAEYVLDILDGEKLDLPVFYDWERVNGADAEIARTVKVNISQLDDFAESFCSYISENGYETMVYCDINDGEMPYSSDTIEKYGLWAGYYSFPLKYDGDFSIWQYGTAEIGGISGETDINIMIK